MANKVKITDGQGTQVFPITHVSAVLDNDGNSIDNLITASITVGSVTTGAAGTDAQVTNTGTEKNAVLNFRIPQGAKGDTVILGNEEEYTLYNTTGQNTDGAMTQKAVTDKMCIEKASDLDSEWLGGNGFPGAQTSGVWFVEGSTRTHYYKKREPSMQSITVTSNSNTKAVVIFSTNYTTPVNGASFGEIGTDVQSDAGETITVQIPDTCEYIMIYNKSVINNVTTDYTPSAVSFGYDGMMKLENDVEEFASIASSVEDLESVKDAALTDVDISISDWNVGKGNPGAQVNDVWLADVDGRTYLWLKRTSYMKYITVTANNNIQSIVRFSTDNNPVNGQKYGLISSLEVQAGETDTAAIPNNCEYIMCFNTTPSNNYAPSKTVFTETITPVIEKLVEVNQIKKDTLPFAKSIFMPEDFEGETLSAKINALNTFILSLPDSMEKVVYFGKNDEYEFTQAFRMPSNTTVVLKDCVVHLTADTIDNVFRSANIIPDTDYPLRVASEITGTLCNLRIIGYNATIKTIWTGNQSYGALNFGWRGYLIIFSFVEGYEVSGLNTDNSLDWQFVFSPCCNYGKIHDIKLNTYRQTSNGDGVNVQGHDISIYNISGRTQDDSIAIGTADEYRRVLRPAEVEVSPHCVIPSASFGDTYNVHICNVHCSGDNHVMAIVPGGNRKIHDIYVSDMSDEYTAGHTKLAVIKFYDGIYNGHYTDGDMYNFFINGVKAKYTSKALIVQGMPHTSMIHHVGYKTNGIDNTSGINFETANTVVSNIYQDLSTNVDNEIFQSIREMLGNYDRRSTEQ